MKLPGGMAVTYKVDGRNRRVAKLVDGTFKRGWIYQDGLRVVGELDSTGALAIRYVYGSRSHVPDYLVRYGTTYRLITDQLGSVRQVVDASSGTVAEAVDYDAWGRITSQQSPGFVSVAYAGGLYDHHTGLVRFGARDYDASVGRWTCKDPSLASTTESASVVSDALVTLYSYCGADPVNHLDMNGLAKVRNRTGSPRIVSGGTGAAFGGGAAGYAVVPPDGKVYGGMRPLPSYATYEEAQAVASGAACPPSGSTLQDIDYYYNEQGDATKIIGDDIGPTYDLYLHNRSRELKHGMNILELPSAAYRDWLRHRKRVG